MPSSQTVALILNSVGAVLEVGGILVLSNRLPELHEWWRQRWNAQVDRFRQNDAALRSLWGTPLAAPVPALRYLFPMSLSATITRRAKPGGTLRLDYVEPTDPDQWREAVWAWVVRLQEQITDLEKSMRALIREEAKDPPRGLALLLTGLAFIIVGNIVAVL